MYFYHRLLIYNNIQNNEKDIFGKSNKKKKVILSMLRRIFYPLKQLLKKENFVRLKINCTFVESNTYYKIS